MTAYLINKFDIVDDAVFDTYVAAVMPLISRHEGRVIVGNKAARGLEGPAPGMNVVIEFPTETAALAFYEDPEYQPVKAIRLACTRNQNAVISGAFDNGAEAGS